MKTKKISWQAIAIVVLALVLIASIALGVSGAWFQDKDTGSSEAKLGHAVELKLQDVNRDSATDGIKGWKELYNSTKTAAYPGDKIIGKTQIKMSSQTPAVVRAKLTPTITDKDSHSVTLDGTVPEAIGEAGATVSVSASSTPEQLQAYYDKLVELKYTNKSKYDLIAPTWNKFLLANMTAGLKFIDNTLTYGVWEGVSKGGWMYLNKVYGNTDLAQNAETATTGVITLFESASLSTLLTNEVQLWTIKIDLVVEAIQAANLYDTAGNVVNSTWVNDMVAKEGDTPLAIQGAVKTYNEGRKATTTPGT